MVRWDLWSSKVNNTQKKTIETNIKYNDKICGQQQW